MNGLSVIDFFCGAGGFSEGFRQQGFEIKMGIDNWLPAIQTFNHNFGLNCSVKNILDFNNSIEEIELLPDTEVIIGSPPCVSFSHSNVSGKADKESGILLTKIFLRIVAVKKFKRNSILKAWFMENVANSKKFLADHYSFKDLELADWAINNRLDPNTIAIILRDNQPIINSGEYGSAQKRKRVISGEIIQNGSLVVPLPLYKDPAKEGSQKNYITLGYIKKSLPKPNSLKSRRMINDPLYPHIEIKASDLSDHFYDTGLYASEWKQSKYLKLNHPYMGKMSFPEDDNRPSRTITATKIGTSREAIIYRSEYDRKGDGEYRTATVREAATLMGFPITYQFKGSEGTKWRLVGNAVCPSVSRAFAKQLRIELNLRAINIPIVQKTVNLENILNLNTYVEKEFKNPPLRISNSRFRRHPFKDGNITVTLSNYDVALGNKDISRWITSVQYGNGDGFPTYNYPDSIHRKLEPLIKKFEFGSQFIEIINNGFSEKIPKAKELQRLYELQESDNSFSEPTELVEEVACIINRLNIDKQEFIQNDNVIFEKKQQVPLKQLLALYALTKITSIVNG